MNKNAVLALRSMDKNSDPVNLGLGYAFIYKVYKVISVFFALCKNDPLNHKVVLIFMLGQIFDLLRPLLKKRRKASSLI